VVAPGSSYEEGQLLPVEPSKFDQLHHVHPPFS